MADEQTKKFTEVLAQLVSSGVNWSEFKLEGQGQTATKKITVSIEVEELPAPDSE